VTRLSTRPYAGFDRVRGLKRGAVHADMLRVDYDHDGWMRRFLASWPESSAAHASYHRRMLDGPRFA